MASCSQQSVFDVKDNGSKPIHNPKFSFPKDVEHKDLKGVDSTKQVKEVISDELSAFDQKNQKSKDSQSQSQTQPQSQPHSQPQPKLQSQPAFQSQNQKSSSVPPVSSGTSHDTKPTSYKKNSHYTWIKNAMDLKGIKVFFDSKKQSINVSGNISLSEESESHLSFDFPLCLEGPLLKVGVTNLEQSNTSKGTCQADLQYLITARWTCLDEQLNQKTICENYFIEFFVKKDQFIFSNQWHKAQKEKVIPVHVASDDPDEEDEIIEIKGKGEYVGGFIPIATYTPEHTVLPEPIDSNSPTEDGTKKSDAVVKSKEGSELPLPSVASGNGESKSTSKEATNSKPVVSELPQTKVQPEKMIESAKKVETKKSVEAVKTAETSKSADAAKSTGAINPHTEPTKTNSTPVTPKPIEAPRPIPTQLPSEPMKSGVNDKSISESTKDKVEIVETSKKISDITTTVNKEKEAKVEPSKENDGKSTNASSSAIKQSDSSKNNEKSKDATEVVQRKPEPHPVLPPSVQPFFNQTLGAPFNGSLSNASSLKMKIAEFRNQGFSAPFRLMREFRERYYGNEELMQFVINLGLELKDLDNARSLEIGDLSAKRGGPVSSHRSHQNGLDIDIAYLLRSKSQNYYAQSILSGRSQGSVISDFYIEEQWKLFKQIFNTEKNKIHFVLVHQNIKNAFCHYAKQNGEYYSDNDNRNDPTAKQILRRLYINNGHFDHYHVRLKCPTKDARCFQQAELPNKTGC